MNRRIARTACLAALVSLSPLAAAAWDPFNGDWGKSDATDLRVMTWNVQDGIASQNPEKFDGITSWAALARVVAMIKPDVLILQEMGDNNPWNNGNVDSVSNLATTIELFQFGGPDPFRGGTVDAYVTKYDASVQFPHVFISGVSDNFNRNVVLSRYPFADLNNDAFGAATTDNFFVQADPVWNNIGGTAGIRGYQFAEIDLPDDVYLGDVVVGNGHLKAGGSSNDRTQREVAAKNISYYLRFLYNGGGTVTPDPNNRITSIDDAGTVVLDANTPIVLGGDLNQDVFDGAAPAEWIAFGTQVGPPDGTDADGTDMTIDTATMALNPSDRSTQGSSKLDYLIWQDSIATARRQFTFRSNSGWPAGATIPDELVGFPNFNFTSLVASDHRPVVVDLILPLAAVENCPADVTGDDAVNADDLLVVLGNFGSPGGPAEGDINGDGLVNADDLLAILGEFGCS